MHAFDERVLALVLQSAGHTDFSFKPGKVNLRGWERESVAETVQKIEQKLFSYKPMMLPSIINKLTTLQPFYICDSLGEARIANLFEGQFGQNTYLLDVLTRLQSSHGGFTNNWQESFILARNLGVKSKNIFTGLLESRGIEPNISRAEVDYFHQQVYLPTPSKL